ncbi:hypothetical protein ACA910_020473 [Epithemia clementina (nom. ined.)]
MSSNSLITQGSNNTGRPMIISAEGNQRCGNPLVVHQCMNDQDDYLVLLPATRVQGNYPGRLGDKRLETDEVDEEREEDNIEDGNTEADNNEEFSMRI